jgi:hypothetical protein
MYLRAYFTGNPEAINTESVMSATEGTVRKVLYSYTLSATIIVNNSVKGMI